MVSSDGDIPQALAVHNGSDRTRALMILVEGGGTIAALHGPQSPFLCKTRRCPFAVVAGRSLFLGSCMV